MHREGIPTVHQATDDIVALLTTLMALNPTLPPPRRPRHMGWYQVREDAGPTDWLVEAGEHRPSSSITHSIIDGALVHWYAAILIRIDKGL